MRRIMKLEYDEFHFEKTVSASTVSVLTVDGVELDAFTMGVDRDKTSWEDFVVVCDNYIADWEKSINGGERE